MKSTTLYVTMDEQQLIENYSLLRAQARATNEIIAVLHKHIPKCREVNNVVERFFQGVVNDHGDIYTNPIYANNKLVMKMRSELIDQNKRNRKITKQMIDSALDLVINIYNGIVAMETPPMIILSQINKALTIMMASENSLTATLTFDDFSVCIDARYSRVYLKHCDTDVKMMMMKYIALAIGHQQWSIPTEVYENVIKSNPNSMIVEGFASPLNSKMMLLSPTPRFCSASFVTDAPFGSIGSFFETSLIWPTGNVSEQSDVVWVINPPFVESLLDATANRCVDAIDYAKENNHKLTIIGITPNWTDMLGYQRIRNAAKYFTVLERNKHFYEGISNNSNKITAKFKSAFYVLSTEDSDDYKHLVLSMRLP